MNILTGLEEWDIKLGGIPHKSLTVVVIPNGFQAQFFHNKILPVLKDYVLVDYSGNIIRENIYNLRSGNWKPLTCMDVNHVDGGMLFPTLAECKKKFGNEKIVVYINDAQQVFDACLKMDKKKIDDYVSVGLTTIAVVYRSELPFNKNFAKSIDNNAGLVVELTGLGKDFIEMNVLKEDGNFLNKPITLYT